MSKFLMAAVATTVAGIAAIAPAPAEAQRSQVEVVVFGDDPCPREAEDEIVVCKRRPEEERFRIPEEIRQTPPATDPARQSWAARVQYLESQNVTGIQQCTAVGPAQTGCLQKEIDENFDKRDALAEDEQAPDQ